MTFNFKTMKDTSRGRSAKWQMMDMLLGGAADSDMLPMWVAQMDFQPAPVLHAAMRELQDCGELGYFDYSLLYERISWWFEHRHSWKPDPGHIFATYGIGNAVGLALQALTEPGDGIIVFSPVYHEFANKIRRNGRVMVEAALEIDEAGKFRMNLDALQKRLTGSEKAVLFCSPHNPAGRCWTPEEIQELSAFCARNDLLLFSDEIHMDLTFPGYKHTPTALNSPDSLPKLVVMSAASKTFDIAGQRTGYVIIPDEVLRRKFAALFNALDIQPNRLGADLTCAAYTPEGAAWADELMVVLNENRKILQEGIEAIPGVDFMPMEATFLAWLDFTNTGMEDVQIRDRLLKSAKILPTPGDGLGLGGALHHRFNIGTPTHIVKDAVSRLQEAFRDLQ